MWEWAEMDGWRLLLEIVHHFLFGNFSAMIDVLFLLNTRLELPLLRLLLSC